MQQNIPRIQIIRDLQFLTNTQTMNYFLHNLEDEEKSCSLQCFSNDMVGYIMALKRMKYMFG